MLSFNAHQICLFTYVVKLEASQLITEITAENLSSLVTSDQLSIDNPNTLHTVGECVTAIRYTNCRLQPEIFTWYLNGSKINDTNFVLDESGKLTFTNAQDIHAGLYFCVITLPGQLGSYITTARQLNLSPTETQGNACNHLLHQHILLCIHVFLCRFG